MALGDGAGRVRQVIATEWESGSGFGRGNLSVYNADNDAWSFSANAGDALTVAQESPGSPGSSGLSLIPVAQNTASDGVRAPSIQSLR